MTDQPTMTLPVLSYAVGGSAELGAVLFARYRFATREEAEAYIACLLKINSRDRRVVVPSPRPVTSLWHNGQLWLHPVYINETVKTKQQKRP